MSDETNKDGAVRLREWVRTATDRFIHDEREVQSCDFTSDAPLEYLKSSNEKLRRLLSGEEKAVTVLDELPFRAQPRQGNYVFVDPDEVERMREVMLELFTSEDKGTPAATPDQIILDEARTLTAEQLKKFISSDRSEKYRPYVRMTTVTVPRSTLDPWGRYTHIPEEK